ncbi:MAG: hypothetical protein R3A80_08545 [Bdellovibrionota bacterium]
MKISLNFFLAIFLLNAICTPIYAKSYNIEATNSIPSDIAKITDLKKIKTRFGTELNLVLANVDDLPPYLLKLYLVTANTERLKKIWELPSHIYQIVEVKTVADPQKDTNTLIEIQAIQVTQIISGSIYKQKNIRFTLNLAETENVSVIKGPIVTDETIPWPSNYLEVEKTP